MYKKGEGVLRRPALTLGVLAISALVALFWISGILRPAPVAADQANSRSLGTVVEAGAADAHRDCPTTEVRE